MKIGRNLIFLALAALAILLFTGCPPAQDNNAGDDNGGNGTSINDDQGTAATDDQGSATTDDDDSSLTDDDDEGEDADDDTEGEDADEEGDVDETDEGEDETASYTPSPEQTAYMAAYKGAEAAEVGSSTCMMCHSDKKPGEEPTHVKALEGDEAGPFYGKACEKCHGPGEKHNGDPTGILNPTKMPQENVVTLCTQCHAKQGKFDVTSFRASTHFRVGNSCVTCHSAHLPNGSFLNDAVPNNVCATCHADKIAGLADGSHGVPNGVCKDCHNPHE